MRRIPTKDCKPGMVLGKPIYNDYGMALINKDVELTTPLINRLLQIGVESVFILDPLTEDIEIIDALSDKTREIALKAIKTTFQDMFKEKLVNKPLIKSDLSTVFKPVLENMLIDLKSNNQAMLMLSTIYSRDLYLYTHSLQVALYSISMGISSGFNQQQLLELGLGALLHDIGKTKVDIALLEKKAKLTQDEFEEIKKHTVYGFDILRKEIGIPLLSAHCAYQHHERIDGSGYPRGIMGEEIHDYAKIIAIADVYDALISQRVYKKNILPHEALEFLFSLVDKQFDRDWVEVFKKTVAIYPIGINVSLNSGESGIVVDINSKLPGRPIIRVLENKEGVLSTPYEIDLSKELAKTITECGS